ncbi:hypothetical protein HDU88_006455 [Geranomyces variabilis]|nr:hypothetical protein HDU88_006455 [Geranomyces variabilis]
MTTLELTTLEPQLLLERAGTILHISEIQRPSRQFGNQASVRVLGRSVTYFTAAKCHDSVLSHFRNPANRLVEFDPIHNLALIEHRGASLAVDAALLGPFHHRIKALLQFIGEVERDWIVSFGLHNEPVIRYLCAIYADERDISVQPPETLPFQLGPGAHHPILRARIARNVDGLDVPLYEQALEIRRRLDIKRAAQEV